MEGKPNCRIPWNLLVCGGLNFPGGFGFRRKKSPLLALHNTNLTLYFQKILLQQAITSFPETNVVNTVK